MPTLKYSAVLALSLTSAACQGPARATLEGHIVRPVGTAFLVQVRAFGPETLVTATHTNDFRFARVRPGSYRVCASFIGYDVATDAEVRPGQNLSVTMVLREPSPPEVLTTCRGLRVRRPASDSLTPRANGFLQDSLILALLPEQSKGGRWTVVGNRDSTAGAFLLRGGGAGLVDAVCREGEAAICLPSRPGELYVYEPAWLVAADTALIVQHLTLWDPRPCPTQGHMRSVNSTVGFALIRTARGWVSVGEGEFSPIRWIPFISHEWCDPAR